MKTIIKYEWISLLRNQILLGAIGVLFLAGIYAIYYGNAEITKQINTIEIVKKAEIESIEKQKAEFKEPNFDVSWGVKRTLINAPKPLAALTIGQRDVFPYYKKVGYFALYGSIFSSEIANPLKLLTGNFDLAFVFIFLLPLLIIALSYNLLSSEQEHGTLPLILVNEISLKKLIFQKLIFRVLVVFAFVLLLFFIGIIWTKTPLNIETIAWIVAVCVYVLFWFSLVFFWVAYRQSSSFNALALLGSWLLFVVIIPTFLNLYLESTRPLGSGTNLQRELRENSENVFKLPRKKVFEYYFTDLPQNKVDTTKVDASAVFYTAAIYQIDKIAKPLFGAYKNQLTERINLSKSISWLSPATQTQTLMNQLADVDTDSYVRFLENMESYYSKLKGFFDTQKLANKKFEKADFDKIPKPEISEASVGNVWSGFLSVLVFILIFIGLGWRKI
jgi:ABC-2 type transport system permease protein